MPLGNLKAIGEVRVKYFGYDGHWCLIYSDSDLEWAKNLKPWTSINGILIEYYVSS